MELTHGIRLNTPINLVHWDNDHWDSVAMGAGDSLTVLLIYDSSKGGSKGGYPLTYTARIINRQN